MSCIYQDGLEFSEIKFKETILNKVSAFMRKHPTHKIYSDTPVHIDLLSQPDRKEKVLLAILTK